jgi:hypothetical protein
MTQTNFVIAVVAYDNRCPLNDDVASQVQLALSSGQYCAAAVTVTTLTQATMNAPTAGSNRFAIELLSPTGTDDETIIALLTAAILALDLPTVPSISVNSVVVFNA